jgi:DNA-binding response OmpR family regulator
LSSEPLILIVEDDAPLRMLWRAALRLEGFETLEAGDGIEALRVLDQRTPDLVILDLGLPSLDGASVRQELAAQAIGRDIPVIIVTGSAEDLAHLDVPCVLRKPVSIDELLRSIHRCMQQSGAPRAGS